jgi:outer membrane biosynthesis protein TonB
MISLGNNERNDVILKIHALAADFPVPVPYRVRPFATADFLGRLLGLGGKIVAVVFFVRFVHSRILAKLFIVSAVFFFKQTKETRMPATKKKAAAKKTPAKKPAKKKTTPRKTATKKKASKKAPWDKKNPKKTKAKSKMTPSQKSAAKARAKKAGRPYPNLVDNMAVKNKSARKK